MKLASLKHGRDGKLIIVNRQLSEYVDASDIVPTLQAALDNWSDVASTLQHRSDALNNQKMSGHPFVSSQCASPLPRAFQWADGSAYVNHVELVRKARGAEIPDSFWHDPLMYQGGSDSFLAPHDDILFAQADGWGIDFEAEVAVITGDVPAGCSERDAGDHIRLLMLVNDVSLRGLIPQELAKGFGFFQSKPSSAFSPVCITPDELGDSWQEYKVHLPLISELNGMLFGKPNAGVDMTFSFAQLIAHAAKTRPLVAGTIVGSGTVSNKQDGGPGKSIKDGGLGYSCLAEIRMIETITQGEPKTPFMKHGDRIRIEMLDHENQSLFGAIEQTVHIVGESGA